MRRSAAPSQQGAAHKRPRFNTPTSTVSSEGARSTKDILNLIQTNKNIGSCGDHSPLSQNSTSDNCKKKPDFTASASENIEPDLAAEKHDNLESSHVNTTPSDSKDGPSTTSSSAVTNHNTAKPFKPVFKSFKSPFSSQKENSSGRGAAFSSPGPAKNVVQQSVSNSGASQDDADTGPKPKYFNVMWCKLSKKKHKKWEGDAILIAKSRTVSLLDTDGKEIGRGSGYKTSELQTLGEGHTLAIGGKEIEVMSLLAEEDFRSGKCFTGGASTPASTESATCLKTMNSGVSKAFSNPQKEGEKQPVTQSNVVVKPRFDPDAPDALVMPQPSQTHQWEHNKAQIPVIDVVVDPYISRHLRPHQRAGVIFLYECIMGMKNFSGQGAILADEMGLGKTIQCIALIWTLLKQGPFGGKVLAKKVLVITPGSLVKNWLREFKKWLGNERLKVFAVSQENKVNEFVDSPMYPVLIVSYEMFMRTIDDIRKMNFDLIICDEGHRLKNTNIKTTTLVSSLPCRRRIILTGTPVQNDLQELYSIVEFCNPGILGTASAFRHVYEEAILASRRPSATPAEISLGETRAMELNCITGLFILRRTSDINNKYLPPKVDVVLFCNPSRLQLSLYKKLLNSRVVKSCLYSRDAAQHLMCISALRKLCNHPSLLYGKAGDVAKKQRDQADVQQEGSEVELYEDLYPAYPPEYKADDPSPEDSGKLSVLSQLLASFYEASPRQRVVLVSNYTQTLDVLEALCKSCGYQQLRLDGQTPTGKRQQLVERFNSQYSQDFVFLLSSKAGGIGLNLIGASRLVLFDIDWNPANDLQAMARVWRDGQRQTVYIYRLLTTGSIEEKIYQRQVTKQALSGVVVDAKMSANKQVQFSQEELKDLFVLSEDTKSVTHDTLGCLCQYTDGRSKEQENTTESDSRDRQRGCQLGKAATSKQKNLCMDELFQWQHLSGPEPKLSCDPLLSTCRLQEVSFVFCCESNGTLAPVSTGE